MKIYQSKSFFELLSHFQDASDDALDGHVFAPV